MVPRLVAGGGVTAVARFLCETIESSDRYESYLVSLAMASGDEASVRVLEPRSWFTGIRVQEGMWEGRSYVHVGARLSELEFMRYMPRASLTEFLDNADLVQFVAGAPCWALAAAPLETPVCVHAATLTATERARRHRVESGPVALWRRAMTGVTRRLDRHAMRTADRVFVMNSSLCETASEICGPERVVLAPPGVDIGRFHPGDSSDDPESPAYILSVARFDDPRKDPETLFAAYAHLKTRRPSTPPLWLAGRSGPPEDAWTIARTQGVEKQVRYLGEVPDEALPVLYRNAACFVLSSDEEGFGLVLTEAMASGTPVVSTACGGPEDIVTDGEDGFLVPVGDADALARAMERLLDDLALRERMGRRARRTAQECYSLEVAGERFLEEYDAMLGAANRAASRERTSSSRRSADVEP